MQLPNTQESDSCKNLLNKLLSATLGHIFFHFETALIFNIIYHKIIKEAYTVTLFVEDSIVLKSLVSSFNMLEASLAV